MKKALRLNHAIQAKDGHWPVENAGPMFFTPPLNEDGEWGFYIERHNAMIGFALSYVALRLLGEGPDDGKGVVDQARKWILDMVVLEVYEWEGCNPLPPEFWIFPEALPYHPGTENVVLLPDNVYAHVILVREKNHGPITDLVLQLRQEIHPIPYDEINWNKQRHNCCKEDLYYPHHSIVQDLLWDGLHYLSEPILKYWPFTKLRERGLRRAVELMRYGAEETNESQPLLYLHLKTIAPTICGWKRTAAAAVGLRQIWEFNPNAGTPAERQEVEDARKQFRNSQREGVYACSDLLMRMQVIRSFVMYNFLLFKRKKKLMIFKVDFKKAFDSLRRDFLELVMAKLRFGTRWRNWIKGCLRHARSSVLVNGSPTVEFEISRGLRQGDPLSLFLFILAMEGLHTLTCKALDNGIFTGAYIGNDNLRISHLIHADDVIFLVKDKQEKDKIKTKPNKKREAWKSPAMSKSSHSQESRKSEENAVSRDQRCKP
uniref:Dammarenediol II synthase-like n=1 Tax=Tanacetum cinerariifolium TaxID=118510 RepID=A0A699GNZ4_TANCI|nr:dammarenediol II synthase-like [Tanacetum cinerariifolium]